MSARKPLAADAAGLGLRRSLLGPLQAAPPGSYDFLEAAPENWMRTAHRSTANTSAPAATAAASSTTCCRCRSPKKQ
jgi:uncharacterized protein (UPF0276 family)